MVSRLISSFHIKMEKCRETNYRTVTNLRNRASLGVRADANATVGVVWLVVAEHEYRK